MSSENIRLEALRHLDAINAGTKQLDDVINDIKKVCFGKSPVPERQLLALFLKYDPKFTPISSSQERKERAALSKKAQESIIGRTVRSLDPVPNDLKLPPGKTIERNHRILFREGTPE
ncbi:MAG: hypothetical protein IIX70_08585, partial [Oscillospiraceae bacterium]|nr:hypothetical protein [Oscillospiraceae bacterium]